MTQRLIAVLIVVGLGVGVWVLWPRDDSSSSTTTTPDAAVSTSEDAATDPTVTLTGDDTTTTPPGNGTDVVETVEEAEAILRELWFGWFEGIYRQDEDRIREVVASQGDLDAARDLFGEMEFTAEPQRESLVISDLEILSSDRECLVTWSSLDVERFLAPGEPRTAVDVIRKQSENWKLFSAWSLRGDLWESDCESLLEPLS